MDRLGKIGATKMMWSVNDLLPPGARWVEYLESTGTQWIDTGVVPSNKIISANLDFRYTRSLASNVAIIGSVENDGVDNFQFGAFIGKWRVKINAFGWYGGSEDTSEHYLEINGVNGTRFDNTTVTTTQYRIPPSNSRNIYLFLRNSPGGFGSEVCYANIKYADIYADGTLIRKFRPIAIGTTGYMLDLVSGEYLPYGNKGTGDFVIGPDISAPAMGGGG